VGPPFPHNWPPGRFVPPLVDHVSSKLRLCIHITDHVSSRHVVTERRLSMIASGASCMRLAQAGSGDARHQGNHHAPTVDPGGEIIHQHR